MDRKDVGTKEKYGAPPASPWAEDAGRHGGEAGETATGAPGLRGGPGPGAAPGMAGETGETGVMPPEGEEARQGDELTMTDHTVQIIPEDEADETMKKKLPPTPPP